MFTCTIDTGLRFGLTFIKFSINLPYVIQKGQVCWQKLSANISAFDGIKGRVPTKTPVFETQNGLYSKYVCSRESKTIMHE